MRVRSDTTHIMMNDLRHPIWLSSWDGFFFSISKQIYIHRAWLGVYKHNCAQVVIFMCVYVYMDACTVYYIKRSFFTCISTHIGIFRGSTKLNEAKRPSLSGIYIWPWSEGRQRPEPIFRSGQRAAPGIEVEKTHRRLASALMESQRRHLQEASTEDRWMASVTATLTC